MINTVGYYIDQAIRDGLLTPDEISSINNLAAGTVTSAEIDNLLTQAQAGLARVPIQPAAFHFAAREPDAGRVLKGNAQVDVAVIDRSSLDLVDSKLDSNGYTLTFKDGSQLFLEEIEFVQFTDLLIRFDPSNNVSQLPSNDLLVVAANYQFFTGRIPTAGGFEYLIASPENHSDLSDPYYSQFNQENRFINFANNLGSVGEGKVGFAAKYGSLSYEDTVRAAYEEIVGRDKAVAAGIDVDAAIGFFLASESFFESVALQRVVSLDVPLELAKKIVTIGSILHEATKVDFSKYGDALGQWLLELTPENRSIFFGQSVLDIKTIRNQINIEGAVLQLYQALTGHTPDGAAYTTAIANIALVSAQTSVLAGWSSMGASLAASNAATLFLQRYVDLANDAFLKAVTKDLLGEERIDGGLQSKLADLIDFYVVNPIPADPTGALRAKGALIGELLYQASLVGEGQFFLAASSFLEGMAAGIQVLGKSLFDIDFQDAPDGVNDTLTGVPGQTNLISGDKGQMFGTARGGNDSITGANDAENTLYGDDAVLLGYSSGGDDTLTGGFNSINNLYGDGISLEGRSWGGNDTLKGAPGGPNNNINFMVGDAEKLGENTRAGNDTLIGGPDMAANFMYGDGLYVYVVQGGGPDYLVTQPKCGDDILISGIASNDTMVGDAISSIITLSDGSVVTVDGVGSAVRGRDTFVFAPDNGIDVVLDFQSGFDKLDLTAYGSALNFAALSTVVTGGNLTIPFDENNSITLMGVTGVKPEDLIFAQ